MPSGDEAKLANRIKKELKQLEREFGLRIDKGVKILSDFTCIKEKDAFKLGIGFAEVDIAIFKQIQFDKSNKQLLNSFKFIQDSKKDKKCLNIPFVILELKSGNPTSDAIRCRNEVARKIKNVFPFCSYVFIAETTSKKEETLFRQGKDFDNFFIFQRKINGKDIAVITSRFIKPYLKNLREIGLL